MRLLLRSSLLVAAVAALVVAGRFAVGDDADSAVAPPSRAPGTHLATPELQSPLAALTTGRHPAAAARSDRPLAAITFGSPVTVSTADTQAAEPSIRVDTSDPNKRIWISAPTGLGARTSFGGVGGDLFWFSDNNGQTWSVVENATIAGGGDSDATTGTGPQVYVTGLTLANVTLAASCDNGQTWVTNPAPTAGTVEDRQWLDMYEDAPKPSVAAPDFLLDIGLIGPRRVALYQVNAPYTPPSPVCGVPEAGPPIDTALPSCTALSDDCYQWPGNLAVDEKTGDVYVTYNTSGNPNNDKVVVARVDGGAARTATQIDANIFTAAANRPDTFDSFTAVAVDTASNVYVVWTERYPATGETKTMYAYSTTKGATWSAPIQVNQAPKTTTFPWIVAGGSGRIDIVYYGTDAVGPSPEEVPASSQWHVYMAQSLNATSGSPTFTEVAATPIMHQGSICTSGTGCSAGTRDLLDFFMVDVDELGLANIAYTNNFNTPGGGEYVTFVQQNGGPGLNPPTAANLLAFDARAGRGQVELRWKTGAEASLLGFNVFRATTGRTLKVNQTLIRARGSLHGASYRLVDRGLRRGLTYWYRLQEVRTDGSRRWLRAVRVSAR